MVKVDGRRIVFLGSKGGPAVRDPSAMPTSHLLQTAGKRIVVDCGIGVTRALVKAGVNLQTLDAVFITHLHSDHVLELGPLIHTAWTTGFAGRLKVFGPPGIAAYWRHFCLSMGFDNAIRVRDEGRKPIEDIVDVREVGSGPVVELDGIGVDALRTNHPPVVDCFAFRFRADGRCVVFSSDTAWHPPLADFASGADVLVHEAMVQAGLERLVARTGHADRLMQHLTASHSLAADAGRIAARAGVEHLCLNHLIPADDPMVRAQDFFNEARAKFSGRITVAHDGLQVDF